MKPRSATTRTRRRFSHFKKRDAGTAPPLNWLKYDGKKWALFRDDRLLEAYAEATGRQFEAAAASRFSADNGRAQEFQTELTEAVRARAECERTRLDVDLRCLEHGC
jgi:hypothetical protein